MTSSHCSSLTGIIKKLKTWMFHHHNIRCSSFLFSLLLTKIQHPSIHEQKCLCGSCRIQCYRPRVLERFPPTCALDNKLTAFLMGCGTSRNLWTGFNSFWLWSGSTWRVLTWADTHRSERLCGSPGFLKRGSSTLLSRRKKIGCIREGRKNFACVSPLPKWHNVRVN